MFATETCAACPLRAQRTRGRGGRTVQVHPQEALLQQARKLQASPAFDEARQRRQVVEHRIARLVPLGIRQARYFGHTKTLLQLCLAAALANLTLLAATSNAVSVSGSDAMGWSLTILAAILSLSSLLLGSGLVSLVNRDQAHLDQPSHCSAPILRRLIPPCRPGF